MSGQLLGAGCSAPYVLVLEEGWGWYCQNLSDPGDWHANFELQPISDPFNLSQSDAEMLMGVVALMLVTAFCFRTLRRFIGQVLQ